MYEKEISIYYKCNKDYIFYPPLKKEVWYNIYEEEKKDLKIRQKRKSKMLEKLQELKELIETAMGYAQGTDAEGVLNDALLLIEGEDNERN